MSVMETDISRPRSKEPSTNPCNEEQETTQFVRFSLKRAWRNLFYDEDIWYPTFRDKVGVPFSRVVMSRLYNSWRRYKIYGKLKCTLVQALRICTDRATHRGSRGIALPFLDHDTRRGWGVSVTPRPFFTPGKDPVPIVQEAGWTPGPVWTGAENLAPIGIWSPYRPARSQSLYRLRYPAHLRKDITYFHIFLLLRHRSETSQHPLQNLRYSLTLSVFESEKEKL